ncbi:hypothetical protein [Rodentibacter pneumotropicus]|uniref:hypothetical protein n=1 Tax=Rodentibacter pneumotropicus TaxID=758 RepID=UPI00109C1CF9|nr:hypothetical protein [Rodentibacter pneumotropicus]THA09412.1 hypothetical protein D3M77_02035 [Rodentibacter pneumotropicus]
MNNAFNQRYHPLATELVNDIFYVEGLSNRSKIGLIRQYTELLVRSLFGFAQDERLTLGDKKTKIALEILKAKSPYHAGVANAIVEIRELGNQATHTFYAVPMENHAVSQCLFNLAKIYACFFVDYFTRYPFGSNAAAMAMFSLLPPHFRLLVLIQLHRREPKNYDIAEKMITVLFKVRGIERVKTWIARNQKKLENIAKTFAHSDETQMWEIIKKGYSAYDFALSKMGLNFHPTPYESFDKAAERYRDYVSEMNSFQSEEVMALKAIMDFVYLGVR